MILYINNKHCTSVAQLQDYFSMDLTPDSDIYIDLLDYGRHGDIAAWLREMGELDLATKIGSISKDLGDSAFYAQLKATITCSDVTDLDMDSLKPTFEECFSFEGVKCYVKDNEAKVTVSLKILMCMNEIYELSVSSHWGTRVVSVNSYNHRDGEIVSFEFTLRKRPGKDVGEIIVMADGIVISQSEGKVHSRSGGTSETFLVCDVKFKMIYVKGGTFMMGATREQANWYDHEKPVHQVTLSSYSIGETPVTQELWQAVMGSNPSTFKGAQRPVENVNWEDCQEFIRTLNQKTGKTFRLPTEAEWEFAARGGMRSKGYQYSGSNDIYLVACFAGLSDGTCSVKTKKPNELGIYDMSGNVFEWCQDWFGSYSSSAQTNPTGPKSGSYRVFRGGCWRNYGCRLSCRGKGLPSGASSTLGLRLVLSD